MKSICFFSSYFTGSNIPYYVKIYLKELIKHFSEVVFITNEKQLVKEDLDFLEQVKIQPVLVVNEGYDFGMWYKALHKFDTNQYDRIGMINDSCILFGKLDDFFAWANKEQLDYCGFTDCDLYSYHIQSYFMIVNKKAIPHVIDYFNKHGIQSHTNIYSLIKVYEIGLSTYLIEAGMKVNALFSFKGRTDVGNPSWMKAKELIEKGYPFIKKRILARNYGPTRYQGLVAGGFDPYPSHYVKLIKRVTGNSEIKSIFKEVKTYRGIAGEIKFHAICIIAIMYGSLRRLKVKIWRALGLYKNKTT